MTLFESVLQQYGTNEPIFSSEISFRNYSQPWIYKQLNQLCKDGKLIRYEKGIYYIPTQTPFGTSLLNPRKVIERKYICQGEKIMGYYSGMTFQNQLRLTTQVPNIIELYTNNETSRVREVSVGAQRVLLRRARTNITAANADVLCFLELMNDLTPDVIDDEKKEIIIRFLSDRKITGKDISAYAPVFPDKAMRTLIESEVIYHAAQ